MGAYYKTIGAAAQQGAAYVYDSSGMTWSQDPRLVASDGAASDQFGCSTAVSNDGNTVAVGAVQNASNKGAVYVFTRSGSTWNQLPKIAASDGAPDDYFGLSIALSGDGKTLVAGALGHASSQGAVYVYVWSGSAWEQKAGPVTAGSAGDQFGRSVALSNDGMTMVVGAPAYASWTGAAYVFTRSEETWTPAKTLTGAAGDHFGQGMAVSHDGSVIAVGAPFFNSNRGRCYVFSGSAWSTQQILSADDRASGDYFSYSSVAFSDDGQTLVVGAYGKEIGANLNQGEAYVFTKSGSSWSSPQHLLAPSGAAGDFFGTSVAASSNGNKIFVGAYGRTIGSNANQGTVYLFTKSGTTWGQ